MNSPRNPVQAWTSNNSSGRSTRGQHRLGDRPQLGERRRHRERLERTQMRASIGVELHARRERHLSSDVTKRGVLASAASSTDSYRMGAWTWLTSTCWSAFSTSSAENLEPASRQDPRRRTTPLKLPRLPGQPPLPCGSSYCDSAPPRFLNRRRRLSRGCGLDAVNNLLEGLERRQLGPVRIVSGFRLSFRHVDRT